MQVQTQIRMQGGWRWAACGLVAAMGLAIVPATIGDGADAPAKAKSPAAQRLDKLKTLAGAWQGSDDDKDGKPDNYVYYRVISGGSAVAEYLMPGTNHEMVSIYHLDGDDLLLTHYCSMGNQPRLVAKPGPVDGPIVFAFKDVTNLRSPGEAHIHDLVMTFGDANHVTAEWKSFDKGKPSEGSATFDLTRITDAGEAAKVAALLTK